MPTILIQFSPNKLANPDADLRYVFPDHLAKVSKGALESLGFDYEDSSDAMLIYLKANDLDTAIPYVKAALEDEVMFGCRLAEGARIGVCEKTSFDVSAFSWLP